MYHYLSGTTVSANINRVLECIENAAHRVRRNTQDIKLLLVTKGHCIDLVKEAIKAGIKDLGENYIEEAIPKIEALRDKHDIIWHMIGHVQSRKASRVCQYFHCIHSVDSLKVAMKLDYFASEQGIVLPILLECNTSGEESKYGFLVKDENEWEKLLPVISEIVNLPSIKMIGLMTMAPFLPNSEDSRQYFDKLRKLLYFLNIQFPSTDWRELSMGMSSDYEVAIEEGATIIRLGQAILGSRPSRA